MVISNPTSTMIFHLKLVFLLDLSYAFALSRQCLRMLSIWPDPCIPLSEFRWPSIRFIIVTCILSFYMIIPQFTNMIRAWGNVTHMVEYIASANFGFMALCKLMATWYHNKSKQLFFNNKHIGQIHFIMINNNKAI